MVTIIQFLRDNIENAHACAFLSVRGVMQLHARGRVSKVIATSATYRECAEDAWEIHAATGGAGF